MKHKLIIQTLACLYFFRLLSSVVQIFVEFSFNPFFFYIFLFALLIVFFILYFWLKPKFKALEAKKHLRPITVEIINGLVFFSMIYYKQEVQK